jgi:methyl-accepting chemotaxis protein
VDQAGATMDEIVASVKRVTDIMGEITAASREQSNGIEQVNRAISEMNEVTQQNAQLVEQATAAAESMQEEAGNLAGLINVFKFGEGEMRGAAVVTPLRSTAPHALPRIDAGGVRRIANG